MPPIGINTCGKLTRRFSIAMSDKHTTDRCHAASESRFKDLMTALFLKSEIRG